MASRPMSALFLTPAELFDLTGFKAPHCQVRWLERNRWRFAQTRQGVPRVARDHFNDKMGCGPRSMRSADAINHLAAIEQPNFAAIGRR